MELQERVKKISLALIQIAVSSRRHDFRARLERLSLDLLERVILNKREEVIESINLAIGLVDFGKIIYEIEPLNALIVKKELSSLLDDVSRGMVTGLSSDGNYLGLNDQIHKNTANFKKDNKTNNKAKSDVIAESLNLSANEQLDSNNGFNAANDNTAIRQTSIIDKIRQMDKPAQLKDLITLFPNISERTLRYDLTRACAEGRLERVGSGPASFYRVRNI